MTSALKIQAGPKAIEEIREKGFSQEMVKMMLGASGGAKWLILKELDKYLSATFFKDRATPLHLLGSSIGSWRFACYARKDPAAALESFKDSYIAFGQEYIHRDDVKKDRYLYTRLTRELVDGFTGSNLGGIDEILSNPIFKLNFSSAVSKGLLSSEKNFPLGLGLATAATANFVRRDWLKHFFTRALFHTDASSPFFGMADFPTERISLDANNLKEALLSSGSIPFVTHGVRGLSERQPSQVYRDGGMVDYHFDIPTRMEEGLILYPHFYDFAIPGWFDKITKTRKVTAQHYERVLMISPSASLVETLPFQKIPDRKDFEKMENTTRVDYWNKVADLGKYMADDFHEMLVKGDILERLS